MATNSSHELQAFHHFLGDKLNGGFVDWSPEEALEEWRRLHPDPEANAEDLAAIQEALADMEKGDRGIPFEEFDRDLRTRYNLPDPA